jgi:hypothetical protein
MTRAFQETEIYYEAVASQEAIGGCRVGIVYLDQRIARGAIAHIWR